MVQAVLVKDVFETYSYFYIDEATKHGFLIDPGAEAEKLLDIISENGWTIEKVLLTHGHFDHTGAVEQICNTLQIPYLIHKNGKDFLADTGLNLSSYCARNVVLTEAQYFEEGDSISLEANEAFSLQVLHTPGHTPDSVVLYNGDEQIAFVGDTIFRGAIGNTGYPGGDMSQLQKSILEKIFQLPGETTLYSGHSEATTVETEIQRYTR